MSALAITAGIALAVTAPLAASAHDYLESSTPESGSTITAVPETFSVTTSEALLDLSGDGSGFAIEVTDSAGLYYGDGCISIVDSAMSMGSTLGAAGDYRMLWQLVGSDGHPTSGEVDFTWAPPADAVASTGSPTPPDCGGEAAAAPESTTAPLVRGDASLGDVLWIGGAIAAVLVAGAVALLVATRRRKG